MSKPLNLSDLPALPDPLDYLYEFGSPFGGVHRTTDSSTWNGQRPKRSVAVYTAEKMQAYALQAIAKQLELDAQAEPVAWRKAILRGEEWGMAVVGWEPCTESEAKYLQRPTRALFLHPQDDGEQAKGWLPIESAPRGSGMDGPGQVTHPDYIEPPRILLATSEGILVGYYDWYYHEGYGRGAAPGESAWRDHDGGRTYGVSHWMPLPVAPSSEGRGEC